MQGSAQDLKWVDYDKFPQNGQEMRLTGKQFYGQVLLIHPVVAA
jgi:hypothetical protein